MRIGPIKFPNQVALAPMAGVSDPPFRQLAAHLGAGMTPSEMITSDVKRWKTTNTQRRLQNFENCLPRILQIVGFCPEMLATAARLGCEQGAEIIDINMGCPAKKVCRRMAGSSLLRDPPLVGQILDRVVAEVDVPVTVKMRTGWSPDERNGVEIAQIAENCGAAALTVHGRTRACKFSGNAEYDTIREIKKAVNIPVIANGDIDSAQKALEVITHTGADGIMIGRAAQGRPWIFNQINSYLNGDTEATDLPLSDVRDIILRHLESLYSFYGEFTGVRIGRKHLISYSRGRDGWQRFREKIVTVGERRQQFDLAQRFFERQSQLNV